MTTRKIHYGDWNDERSLCGRAWTEQTTAWDDVTCSHCLRMKRVADRKNTQPFFYQDFDMLKVSEIKTIFSADFWYVSQNKDIWQKVKDAGVTIYGNELSGSHKTVRYGDMIKAGFVPAHNTRGVR